MDTFMKPLGLRLTKSEKALIGLALVNLVLWVVRPAIPTAQSFRYFTLIVLLVLVGLVAVIRIAGLGRWLARKTLWRVRHRMVAVFFFVGVLPVSLGALLVVWGSLVLLGPIAAHIVTSEFEGEVSRLRAMASPLLWQSRGASDADLTAMVQRFHANASELFPDLEIRLESNGRRISHPDGALEGEVPSKLGAPSPFVRKHDGIFLAAVAEDELGEGRIILAVPMTDELAQRVLSGIGVVVVSLGDLADRAAGSPRPSQGMPAGDEDSNGSLGIPPQRHGLDLPVQWIVASQVLNWDDGEIVTAPYYLRTRLSALWETIFANQTEFSYNLFRYAGYGLLAAFAISVLISRVIATSLTRTLTRAVNDLYVGTMHVNKGDFRYRIPVRGSDQVSDLSGSFNEMTRSIEQLIEESKRRQQLEAEIEVAREVQSSLFPVQLPKLAGLEVLGICRPARSVSGDFYDYVELGEECIAFSFGDVSGKGISAALVMAAIHSIVRAQLTLLTGSASPSPEQSATQLVERANLHLCAVTPPEKFSTLFFGSYDARSGTLAYSNAGHLPPLLLRNGNLTPLEVNGMIVGALPHAEYSAASLVLEPGDMLVAYTDGLTEPEDQAGDEFGEERLREALQRLAGSPLRDLIEGVMNDVVDWTGDPVLQDDMTMLVVRKL